LRGRGPPFDSGRRSQHEGMSSPRETLRVLAIEAASRLIRPREPKGAVERLLLVRPDHFGDVLLTSPAVAQLRRSLPDTRLTLLVGPWSAEVARRGAEVDEILTCEFPGFTRRPKPNSIQPYRL